MTRRMKLYLKERLLNKSEIKGKYFLKYCYPEQAMK